jgi:serine/threonine protein kinase
MEVKAIMTANAADNLAGVILETGWEVLEKLEKVPGATGCFFSVCYRVRRGQEICFLKAFNFARFFQQANSATSRTSVVDVVSEMLEAYKYERDLSEVCRNHHVTKVLFVKDAGEAHLAAYPITIVPYLIFDLAECDVRTRLRFSNDLDTAWRLRSLHSVAIGLQQLHAIGVTHQDLKPSNVLQIGDESKIGDLGRSTCASVPSPLKALSFTGDWGYAPPEILYNSGASDWSERSLASDSYLFGSLIVFYFTGINMNALLRKHLPDALSWEHHRGPLSAVEAYLLEAFRKALDELSGALDPIEVLRDLREIVARLCHPNPQKRQDPQATTPYDLERVISQLDLLHSRMKYRIAHEGQ